MICKSLDQLPRKKDQHSEVHILCVEQALSILNNGNNLYDPFQLEMALGTDDMVYNYAAFFHLPKDEEFT